MKHVVILAAAVAALSTASACNERSNGSVVPASPASNGSTGAATDVARPDSGVSVLKQLTKKTAIGSTVDPRNGSQNPYGLTIVPTDSGKLNAGDLLVCNFNARSNVQGTGTSIVALSPTPGSKPRHISADASLKGCDALALGPDDIIWAASMVANDNPVIDAKGNLLTNIKGMPFDQPWGQVYANPKNAPAAFYETNAGDGTVVRINLGSTFTYDVIAKGFPVNHGVPGTALAPSGLAYDRAIDTLYFADGKNNTIVAIENVTKVPNGGITATNNGTRFSGSHASSARVVYSGKPLDGPISTALLYNGNIVAGNTLDPDGKNLLIEISPAGKLLDVKNVDRGPAGAIFGIVISGSSLKETKVYFNDDNKNEVQVLEP